MEFENSIGDLSSLSFDVTDDNNMFAISTTKTEYMSEIIIYIIIGLIVGYLIDLTIGYIKEKYNLKPVVALILQLIVISIVLLLFEFRTEILTFSSNTGFTGMIVFIVAIFAPQQGLIEYLKTINFM